MTAIAEQVDVLVMNRFGRAEALGRGLINCFLAAIEANIVILTAVRHPYGEPWAEFHGGLAQSLRPELNAIQQWCLASAAGQFSEAAVA
jgi:Protein of unknown function (DUF2478)